jgi:CheY-like chemotaxis protein
VLGSNVGHLSGPEIIEALKRGPNTQHVRAILLAGGEADKRAALEAGASAHVSPSDLTGLRDTLEALMGIRH